MFYYVMAGALKLGGGGGGGGGGRHKRKRCLFLLPSSELVHFIDNPHVLELFSLTVTVFTNLQERLRYHIVRQ